MLKDKYNPQEIEKKWQKAWQKNKTFAFDLKKAKRPYYNLMMFPYPSAEGLHVGNVYAFTGSDIHGRFKKMQGKDVFEPMGFDAFGIHSENFAIKKGIHPKVLIKKNVDNFRQQLKSLGCLFDWDYQADTTKPDYYAWTQWLFLQLFKAGLAYRQKAAVDWCPSCKTVLADEQVIEGKCERCDSVVIQKELEQWFFRITKYAEKLLKNLDKIDWSEKTKTAQRNWIGKSEGAIIKFSIYNHRSFLQGRGPAHMNMGCGFQFSINVFTTRPDTLFGATYMVVAPEHSLIENLKSEIKNWDKVQDYIKQAKKKSELERTDLIKEKTGIEIKGIKAINPANQKEVPIFAADYVLASYGTGAVMGVPAHDQRDFDFAKKYSLPIVEVVSLEGKKDNLEKAYEGEETKASSSPLAGAWEGEGILINSGRFDRMKSEKARPAIIKFVKGKKTVNYHLRDWLISRQRYWGPPIPIIYCEKCGSAGSPQALPVPEKDLPVLLPYVKNFRPKGTGKSPLASIEKFVKTKCPKCQGPAKRETDVSDTFLDSSWYFFRYLSPKLKSRPFDEKLVKKWLPVDMYIGGQEHAVLHLLYTRFITMALKDLGFIGFEEPFKKFRAHGLLTKGGSKMSKSKGNVVNPDDYYQKYGADTLRMYLMFLGPFQGGGGWQDKGIVGIKRFLEKVWAINLKIGDKNIELANKNPDLEKLLHQTIKKVTEDLESLSYNTAISALMILVNKALKQPELLKIGNWKLIIKLLAPFTPYIAEELWLQAGGKGSVHHQLWPKYNPRLIKKDKITLVIQVNGKVRDKVEAKAGISEQEAKNLALSQKKIKNWLSGKKIKRIVFVPGKLINIVTN